MQTTRIQKLLILVILFSALQIAAKEKAILVSAASSLTNAFMDMSNAFYKKENTRVYTNFASSGHLLQQIKQGAPADILASADEKTVEDGIRSGILYAPSKLIFARNELVVIQPVGTHPEIHNLSELTNKQIHKIAVGNAITVPAGRYAEYALKEHKLYEKLKPKFIPSENVRQVLEYVERGEVEAGFVYATDLYYAKGKVQKAFSVPMQKKILYPIVLVVESKDNKDARKFLKFVTESAEAEEILKDYGFLKPQ